MKELFWQVLTMGIIVVIAVVCLQQFSHPLAGQWTAVFPVASGDSRKIISRIKLDFTNRGKVTYAIQWKTNAISHETLPDGGGSVSSYSKTSEEKIFSGTYSFYMYKVTLAIPVKGVVQNDEYPPFVIDGVFKDQRTGQLVMNLTAYASFSSGDLSLRGLRSREPLVFSRNSQGAVNQVTMVLAEEHRTVRSRTSSMDVPMDARTAVAVGDQERIQQLLAGGQDINGNIGGSTLLISAAMHGRAELVASLLARGADVNRADNAGRTALMLAVEMNNKPMVSLLLSKGADVRLKDDDGRTALSRAQSINSAEIVELLRNAGAEPLPAPEPVSDFSAEQVAPVVKNAALENVPGYLSRTLQDGVASGNKEAVEDALARGADINVRDKYGRTLLFEAVQRQNGELIDFLVSRGLGINAQDVDGYTVLSAFADFGDTAIIEHLLALGGDPNIKTNLGVSPLMSAASRCREETVKVLLAHGADVNTKDKMGAGKTVLQYAINGDVDGKSRGIVDLIIAQGANINAGNRSGWTALMTAVTNRNQAMVEHLLSKGADIDAQNNFGQTALSIAETNQSAEIASLLREAGAR